MEQYQLEEVKFSFGEVMEYLEEVINMGMAEDFEEDIYNSIKWQGVYSKRKYNKVIHNMIKLYGEKF